MIILIAQYLIAQCFSKKKYFIGMIAAALQKRTKIMTGRGLVHKVSDGEGKIKHNEITWVKHWSPDILNKSGCPDFSLLL